VKTTVKTCKGSNVMVCGETCTGIMGAMARENPLHVTVSPSVGRYICDPKRAKCSTPPDMYIGVGIPEEQVDMVGGRGSGVQNYVSRTTF
jgi:hypothetical protein